MSFRSLRQRGADTNVELGMRLQAWFRENDELDGPDLVRRLRSAFGVCRATAYRYVAAYRRVKAGMK